MSSSIALNLNSINDRINKAKLETNRNVRLVAVSKLKTIDDIIDAYKSGQRHFGENYVQELEEKANSELIKNSCPDIKWHFIGHLQSNKAKKVASVPNLFVIETVDSLKLAEILESYTSAHNFILNVMIQVNTSNEDQKGGISTSQLTEVYQQIKEKCKHLNVLGLMTIGSYEQSTSSEENADFKCLIECKKNLVEKFNLDSESIEISMGMSHDFEQAIKMGSTNVRVGSLIFGERK